MIATQAANFLTATNDMPDLRALFPSIYAPLLHNTLEIPSLGHALVFSDESILLALNLDNTRHLVVTSIKDGPEALIDWAIEHNQLAEIFQAISTLMETTNEAQ